MKTTMKFFMSYMMVIALVVFASCKKDNLQDAVLPQNTAAENTTNSAGGTNGTNGDNGDNGDDGEDGADGADGTNGSDGTDGNDGADGADGSTGPAGADGADGVDGANGADGAQGPAGADGATGPQGPKGNTGNANVVVYSFDISSKSGSFIDQSVPQLTENVLKNDLVLGYVKESTRWYPLPAVGDTSFSLPFDIAVSMKKSTFSLDFVNRATGAAYSISAGNVDRLKVVVIKSSSVLGLTLGSKGEAEKELKNMSYKEVCAALNIPE